MNFTKGLVRASFLFILSASFSLNFSCAGHPAPPPLPSVLLSLPKTDLTPAQFAFKKMTEAGISKKFIDQMRSHALSYGTKDDSVREKVVFLNIFGFLTKGEYVSHYSAFALKKSTAFSKIYSKSLREAEKKYHVSKKIIAALLWVETKHGKHTGTLLLPEVYFDLLQASHPSVAQRTLVELESRKPTALQTNPSYTERSLEEKIIERSQKKSDWALKQLKALDQMNQEGIKGLFKFKASYAGAFGNPQFIPTAYLEHAVSAETGLPNLFKMRDSIFSVAHFLKDYGWDDAIPASQVSALYEYNHAKGYGEVILKIASELE